MKRTTLLSLLALLLVAPAFAGNAIVLNDPLPVNPKIKAWGMASRGLKAGVQFFDVRADVNLPNGSWLLVEINRDSGDAGAPWVGVCKAEVILGTATCRLNSKNNVSPAFPIKGISGVMVKYRGEAILKGHF